MTPQEVAERVQWRKELLGRQAGVHQDLGVFYLDGLVVSLKEAVLLAEELSVRQSFDEQSKLRARIKEQLRLAEDYDERAFVALQNFRSLSREIAS